MKQHGSTAGALGGPPAHRGQKVGEKAIAPARYLITCGSKHKIAVELSKSWHWEQKTRKRVFADEPFQHYHVWEEGALLTAHPNEQGEYDIFAPDRFVCPECGRRAWKWAEVRGAWASDVPCSAKCTNASGHSCDCVCGGRNHGSHALNWYETRTVGKPTWGTGPSVAVTEVVPPEPTADERKKRNPSSSTPRKREFPCSRCGGTGKMPYSLQGGVCFKCGGSGKQYSPPAAKVQKWAVFFPYLEPTEQYGTHFVTYQTGKTATQATEAATKRLQRGTVASLITAEGAFAITEAEDLPRVLKEQEIQRQAWEEANEIHDETGEWPYDLYDTRRGIPYTPVFAPKRNPRTFVPPASVADEARRGLELRASMPPSRRGGTAVGIRRAVQLANRQPVSEDTLARMRSYFQRHAVDAQGRGWDEGTSKGWQSWLLWGGYAGRDFANKHKKR